jgi:hypothetical protein
MENYVDWCFDGYVVVVVRAAGSSMKAKRAWERLRPAQWRLGNGGAKKGPGKQFKNPRLDAQVRVA